MSLTRTPMSMANLLEHYRSMGRLTHQMLDAARNGHWETLVELETARTSLEAELRHHDVLTWHGAAAVEKARLLQFMLSSSPEIAALVAKRMGELRTPLSQVSLAIRVNQDYGKS